jgi:MoaA/NifB/PqqE/SkfB family radical SAM enzyme
MRGWLFPYLKSRLLPGDFHPIIAYLFTEMVNSVRRRNDMKDFMRGKVEPWNCRAGQNSLIIRVDGTLAPCFPMYFATHDWGVVGDHNFQVPQLNEMKKECQTHCFSTLNHNLGYCYGAARALKWVLKQATRGFQGTSGSFHD